MIFYSDQLFVVYWIEKVQKNVSFFLRMKPFFWIFKFEKKKDKENKIRSTQQQINYKQKHNKSGAENLLPFLSSCSFSALLFVLVLFVIILWFQMNLLRPIDTIPQIYLPIFNYSSFNDMQSSLFHQVYNTDVRKQPSEPSLLLFFPS